MLVRVPKAPEERLWFFYTVSLLAALPFWMAGVLPLNFIPLSGQHPYPSLIITLFSVWMMTCYVERRPFSSLGLRFRVDTLVYLFLGFLAAFVTNVLIRWLIFASYLRFPTWPFITLVFPGEQPFAIVQQVAISVYEELYFRSYALQTLITIIGTTPALLVTSFFFGVLHPPGWIYKAIAALLGIVMSMLYVRTRSLWMSIGFHFGWNFTSTFVEFPISGGSVAVGWEVSFASHAFILGLLLVLVWKLPLRPHPRDRELWDRYVKPAPWPPWRRPPRSGQSKPGPSTETEGSQSPSTETEHSA